MVEHSTVNRGVVVQALPSQLWLYGIKVIISDCLSEDLGSIPNRVVYGTLDKWLSYSPFTAAMRVRSSHVLLCGKPDVKTYFLDAYET